MSADINTQKENNKKSYIFFIPVLLLGWWLPVSDVHWIGDLNDVEYTYGSFFLLTVINW